MTDFFVSTFLYSGCPVLLGMYHALSNSGELTSENPMRSLYHKSYLLLKTKLNACRCKADISLYFTRKWT